jgi:hypothetical protein
LILLIVIWPLLASSRLLRGEEERGSLDALLSGLNIALISGVFEDIALLLSQFTRAC